jgi:DNA-nicking Smr family endonuclease
MSAKKKRRPPQKGAGTKAADAKAEAPFYQPFAKLPAPNRKTAVEAAPAPRAPAPPPRKPKIDPIAEDSDDQLSFERLMSGVVPLDDTGVKRVSHTAEDVGARLAKYARTEAAQAEQRSEQDALARLHALVEEGSRFEVVDDGRHIEGRRRGADGGTIRRMRHGELPVDAKLDLHGMRVADARGAVEAFICDRRARGDRVVVLVHGRGRNSPGGQAVLRGEIAAWLSEGAAAKHVAAFSTAPPELGGEGAMSVLLAHPNDMHRGMR